jgi:hypothetical protein
MCLNGKLKKLDDFGPICPNCVKFFGSLSLVSLICPENLVGVEAIFDFFLTYPSK